MKKGNLRKADFMKKGNLRGFVYGAGILLGVCVLGLGITVNAEDSGRRSGIQSMGNLNFGSGKVYIASEDFRYLADEIDNLESTYKINLVGALNQIGTYFKNDGTATWDIGMNEADTDNEIMKVKFSSIINGITVSQAVEADAAAIADNLSLGKTAWVNGSRVVGNGADNAKFREEGYREGYALGVAEALSKAEIIYTYHTHTGTEEEVGGCYDKLSEIKSKYCGCNIYAYEQDAYGTSRCANCKHNHSGTCKASVGSYTHTYIGLACGKTEETIESATIIY